MKTDEQQIREMVRRWIAGTAAADVAAVLDLIADDALFLTAGRPPMSKTDYATAAAHQAQKEAPEIQAFSDIQEIRVVGEWAFMRTKLKVIIKPPGGSQEMIRAGDTLSVLRKEGGKWLLVRDANLLTSVNDAPAEKIA